MKANAPEKIWVHEASAFELTEKLPYHIEYTRTDAFIEKAEEYIYNQLNEGCIECGDIKRFVENMKKYMKGDLRYEDRSI